MKLAICAPFMESDLWQERLRRAAPRAALEFDEFYRPEEIRSVPGFRYDAGVVAMKGARGLELATALREQSDDLPLLWLSDDLPLLWLSDDEKFGLAAFDLGVAMLLPLNCTDRELADGLRRCGVKERWEAMG